jgi:hypothetical protein
MGFTHIDYLWLLLAMPLLAGLLCLSYLARKQASEAFRPSRFRIGNERKVGVLSEIVHGGGFLLAATLMVVAIAGPYQNDKPVRVPEGPVHACFVIDVSRSMAAEDYRQHMPADAGQRPDLDSPWGSRLQMAKYQIERIMDAITGNQVCLVTYTERGFAQAILGSDFNALRFVLKRWVKIGTAPGDGSNYAHGMETALDILKDGDAPGKQKVIILLTDGGYTGDREQVAKVVERLKSEHAKLVIVGVGTPGEHAIPLYIDGARRGQMEKDGKPITTSYEEDDIRELKSQTGAGYTHISLNAESPVVTVDWMTEIGGSKIVYEKRRLDVYLAGTAYAIIAIMVLFGLFTQRQRLA